MGARDDAGIAAALKAYRDAAEAVALTSHVIEPHGRCYRALELASKSAASTSSSAIDAHGQASPADESMRMRVFIGNG